MTASQAIVHGTALAVAVDADGPLIGILLMGEAGVGKTSAALELIESCPHHRTRLIADDQVAFSASGDDLIAKAPDCLSGQAELRGAGPFQLKCLKSHPISMAFERDPSSRLHDPRLFSPLSEPAHAVPLIGVHQFSGLKLLMKSILTRQSLSSTVDWTTGN